MRQPLTMKEVGQPFRIRLRALHKSDPCLRMKARAVALHVLRRPSGKVALQVGADGGFVGVARRWGARNNEDEAQMTNDP